SGANDECDDSAAAGAVWGSGAGFEWQTVEWGGWGHVCFICGASGRGCAVDGDAECAGRCGLALYGGAGGGEGGGVAGGGGGQGGGGPLPGRLPRPRRARLEGTRPRT